MGATTPVSFLQSSFKVWAGLLKPAQRLGQLSMWPCHGCHTLAWHCPLEPAPSRGPSCPLCLQHRARAEGAAPLKHRGYSQFLLRLTNGGFGRFTQCHLALGWASSHTFQMPSQRTCLFAAGEVLGVADSCLFALHRPVHLCCGSLGDTDHEAAPHRCGLLDSGLKRGRSQEGGKMSHPLLLPETQKLWGHAVGAGRSPHRHTWASSQGNPGRCVGAAPPLGRGQ